MRVYPIMLDLHGRKVVVVGSGSIGMRRARSLLRCQADLTLVAPEITEAQIAELGESATVLARPYAPDMLNGAALVLACTDDPELNHQIASAGRKAGALVNVADQLADCDFHMPAIIEDGQVVVAIATGGSAPGLASSLKRRLARAMPKDVGAFAAMVGELRADLQTKSADSPWRMGVMKQISGDEGYDLFVAQGPDAVRARLQAIIKANGPPA